MDTDPLALNVIGPADLISSPANKLFDGPYNQEGTISDPIDELELNMTDEELLTLKERL